MTGGDRCVTGGDRRDRYVTAGDRCVTDVTDV